VIKQQELLQWRRRLNKNKREAFSFKKMLDLYFIKGENYIGFLWCFYKLSTATSASYKSQKEIKETEKITKNKIIV